MGKEGFHCVTIKDGSYHMLMGTCTFFFTRLKETIFMEGEACKIASLIDINI